jgi:predicted RNase H-like HicB family nuclease
MRQARYEIVDDDGSFYGDIPAIPGVWANAKTLEGCREELESVLEGWVLLSRQAGIERKQWEAL